MCNVSKYQFYCFGENDFGDSVQVASLDNPGHPAVFLHGESAVWDTEQQCLYFVDVVQQNVHKLEYSTGKILTKHIGKGK